MSDERLDTILDAAYACFSRHGVRRTTMDDIAAEAGMSRPALYQHVRNKDDAFRRLAERLYATVLAQAATAAAAPGDRVEKLRGILGTKVEMVLKLFADGPHHAAELIGEGSRIAGDLDVDFQHQMRELLVGVIDDRPVANLLLALIRGLEADLSDPDAMRAQLRLAVELIVAGHTAYLQNQWQTEAKA